MFMDKCVRNIRFGDSVEETVKYADKVAVIVDYQADGREK